MAELRDNHADGHHAKTHDNGTDLQHWLAANAVNDQLESESVFRWKILDLVVMLRTYHSGNGADQEHNASDTGSQQSDRTAGKTKALEDV